MPKNQKKTICFIHYGIGWRDGVNTVIKTFAEQIQKQRPNTGLCFVGGEIKERFLKGASYKIVPELLPSSNGGDLDKEETLKRGEIIAEKISRATKGADVVIIENPFLGGYCLPAMLGFLIYAERYKPREVKVFFRVHDLYTDNSRYYAPLKKLFSKRELKKFVGCEKVDGFFVINNFLKKDLVDKGVSAEKIFFLPNGVNEERFSSKLNEKQKENLLCKTLDIPKKNIKKDRILLYPVRVVPRKNIEEAILLTHCLRRATREDYILIISGKIDENDPLSRDYYKALKRITEKVDFLVVFTKGVLPLDRKYGANGKIEEYGISDLYHASHSIIMTSAKEGFGYPFLECWLAGRTIIGKRVENVISDFEKKGLSLGWLYSDFWIGGEDIPDFGEKRMQKVLEIFNNNELQDQVFEKNKGIILQQAEILQNRAMREEIIKLNQKAVHDFYVSSKITKRFLKLVGI